MKPVHQKSADKTEAAAMQQRLRGLLPAQAGDLRRAIGLVRAGDQLMSGMLLLALQQQAPDHPEVLYWCGQRHANLGEWADAARHLARAAGLRPHDLAIWLLLGTAQEHIGEHTAALNSLRTAAGLAIDTAAWLKLSLEFDRQGHFDDALAAIQRVLQREPDNIVGLLQRSRCFKALGQAAEAGADCRRLIANGHEVARAWFSLVDLKTVALTDGERGQLQRSALQPGMPAAERQLLDFSLGKALEDAGEVAQAFVAFRRANDAAMASHPWNGTAFAHDVAAVRAAFSADLPFQAQQQGREVIFLVGLPRSGTTLVEQVVASHSTAEGASELPYLSQVIDAQSRRRGLPFPAWVASTTSADWTRLGQHYLRLSERWRASKPIATDKLPENWLLAGAALAMLPDARVIDCRRDPVETCWSCYKQLFGPDRVNFTYSFEGLGSYWQAYDSLCRFWAARYPQRFRVQQYAALVADPETQIRQLLDFCGLPFEPQCLQFQTAQRAIRTPSALQVRQPMTKTSTPAAGYGALLDPLRALLVPLPD